MFRRSYRSWVATSLLIISTPPPIASAIAPRTANTAHMHSISAATTSANPSSVTPGEATVALDEGRKLLRLNQADQAFTKLELALRLFTAANDRAGVAAVQDAMGDIYRLSGQYNVALQRYTESLSGFRAANDISNANAILSKIGETHFLSGDTAAAQRAFSEINAEPPGNKSNNSDMGNGDGGSSQSQKSGANGAQIVKTGGGTAGVAASFASCLLPLSNLANNSGNNSSNPQNMGRAPKTPNGVGRMDLRITDEAGNPIKGVQAQIKSKRPGGLFCECFESTDAIGRAVMPPLHIADKIKLALKGAGYPSQEIALNAQDLSQPVRVVLSKTGAQVASAAAQVVVNPCLDFYRALISYGTSELGEARAELKNNQLAQARARYEKLLLSLALPGAENLGQVPRFRAAARIALADIAFKENRFADATNLYTEARDAARADNRLDLTWAAERGLGRTLWKQATLTTDPAESARLRSEALPHYREALKAIETIRDGSLRADDARTLFLATTKDVYDEASAALIESALAAHSSASGANAPKDFNTAIELKGYALTLAAEAFKISEQGRARSLLDMLSEARGAITEGVPAETLKRRGDVAARQQEIVQFLTGVALANQKPSQSIQELEAELNRLSIEYDGLENLIRTRSPRYGALTGAQTRSLSDIQSQVLDDQTVLLSYQLGSDKSFLWAVTRNGVYIALLPPRAGIEEQALNLRAQLIPVGLRRSILGIDGARSTSATPDATARQAADANTYATAAHNLFKTIVQPAKSILTGKRILVVADGALNYVPLEALVTEPTVADADYSSLAYLVKTNEIVYAPSASVVAVVRAQVDQAKRAAGAARTSMLIIADPVFTPTDERASALPSSTTASSNARTRGLSLTSALTDIAGVVANLNLMRLVGTREEANSIAQFARAANNTADVLLDLDASETKVVNRDMRNYQVLHFATHGLLNAERPQFTGIVLSLVGEQGSDGFLRANEIFNFRLGAPLVMLSACESGLGRERRGEGVIGLTRAFMYAGAPTVGVSLWSVSDRSTARLMGDFYKEYLAQADTSPTEALRRAQLNMIANNRYNAPFFWAPFVLVGDWR